MKMPLKFKQLETSAQMRLYTLTKRQFVLVFGAFIACFLITVIIGVAGPPILSEHSTNAKELSVQPKDFNSGPFTMESGMLTVFNQQLWLLGNVQLQSRGVPTKKLRLNFHLTVKILGRTKDSSYRQIIKHAYHNRTRSLKCSSGKCDHVIVLHLADLEFPSYMITVNFYGLNTPRYIKIRNVVFTFRYYNSDFTQIEIWFRFVFLVLAFTVACLFAHSLRRFPVRDWSIEQKWMSVLLPLLLLYNDPIFPMNFLLHSWVPSSLDAIFQTSFLSALLLFWLCAFHGVRQSDRTFTQFYLPKLALVGFLWLFGCVLVAWQQFNELRDPSYNYKIDTGNFIGLKVVFFIIGGLYLIYLVYLMYAAFSELKNMPYFDIRLKFLTALMVIVIVITLLAVGLRFGPAFLHDNFVAEITTNYDNSAEFLAFYGLFNFYLYTMAFVYSPSKSAIREATSKDSETFSMLYDSDEDIIYGKPNLVQVNKSEEQKDIDGEDSNF